jgi:hypothetical protein
MMICIGFQYACRKALADSQPRIRGRFAKNEESETNREWSFTWSRYVYECICCLELETMCVHLVE